MSSGCLLERPVLKMFRFIPRVYLKCLPKVNDISGKRCFLSAAYKCSDVWQNRLQNKVFKNLNLEDLYCNLDERFKLRNRVSFIDIDLFLSGVNDSDFKNEIEDVLVRFRLCPECSILPERATHAAIRWYMDHAPKEDLLNALSDRLNFGLFTDYYLSNLLMNNFIVKKDVTSAAKIAVLQMLQEDFGNSLNKALALYSCFAYLDSPDVWPSLESTKKEEDDDDENVQNVRVPYLRNPYFDDHFDITNTNHLVGKTIHMLGTVVEGSLGTSCQLIGLVLYEKYEKACKLLKELLESKKEIHSDALERVSNYLSKPPKQSVIEGEDNSKESESGENSQKSESGDNSKAGDSDKFKKEMLQLLGKVEMKSSAKKNLLEEIREFVEKAVKENEENDIKFQTQLYKQWEEDRKRDIEVELARKKRENVMMEIEKTKKELELEEEKLFYFDKEDEIELRLEEVEKEKESVVFWSESGKSGKIQEDYIPPDVSQRKI